MDVESSVSILLVDRNTDDRQSIIQSLSYHQAGQYSFLEADSPHLCFELLEKSYPDIIVFDLFLPHDAIAEQSAEVSQRYGDTVEPLRFLTELNDYFRDAGRSRPLLVVLTRDGNEVLAVQALKSGADDYLVKLPRGVGVDELHPVLSERIQLILEQRVGRQKLLARNEDFEMFTRAVAHDLKSPLRRSQQLCKMLISKSRHQLDEATFAQLGLVEASFGRLQQVIQGLLGFYDSSKISEPRRRVELWRAVDNARLNLGGVIEESGAKLEVSELPTIIGYESALVQLFQNLIQNAIKFQVDGEVSIQISCVEESEVWRVNVVDNGIGMEVSQTGIIFNAFERLHSQEEFDGSGLGLAICSRIVDLHLGRIWVESEVGKGSCFSINFPKPVD